MRAHHSLNRTKPERVADPPGLHHRARIVDHGHTGLRSEAAGGIQRRLAEVGVADGIEDQLVRRQPGLWVEMIGDNDGRQEARVVEEQTGRNVAAARGDQLQQPHRRLVAAVWQRRDGAAAKALVEMLPRTRAVAEIGEHGAEPLVRRRLIRIDPQRRLVMFARFLITAGAQQEIGEVDMRHRIAGMVQDRFRIDPAGGVDRAHLGQQRPEFVQRAEIGRRLPQDRDKGVLRVLASIERSEQYSSFDFEMDGVASCALMCEQVVELSQPGLLRQPRRPAGAAVLYSGAAFCVHEARP